MAVEIHLKGNKEVALVDAEDYELIAPYRWSLHSDGYATAQTKTSAGWRPLLMHRIVLDAPQGTLVDHKNGDRLDNRRCNLRLATRSQNAANTPPKPGRLKGVFFDKARNLWQARIMVNWKERYIGRFLTQEEAARAYDLKAREYFGEFAALNYPES